MAIDLNAILGGLPAFPRLRSARTCLRGPHEDDAPALFALFSDPAVMRYWSRPPMLVPAEAIGLVTEIRERFVHREMIDWMIADARSDQVIGTYSLFHFDGRLRHAGVGYALRSDLWGGGLATEAVAQVLDWGFRTLGLGQVHADIEPCNADSRRLLGRLGFTSAGMRAGSGSRPDAGEAERFSLDVGDWHRPGPGPLQRQRPEPPPVPAAL